ncbi:S-layer homology domain-containing protein [Intestinimonas butyriciproducens]|uniref:S-layer homology domain-containing protein n=1 Tax=Intestinimonas butyriciproducens TaxID=1297617 RepID=UPI001959A92A|nr:S-layer homology domain-containing protein [Intestinimonas butyriciproducens]MBM6977584.1 S-layer homology domain-containing protein [Intestinimonas butyriciproducens]
MKTKFSSKKLMASLLVAILSLSIVGVNIFGALNAELYSGYIQGNTVLGETQTLTDPSVRDKYNDLIFVTGKPGSAAASGYGSFYTYRSYTGAYAYEFGYANPVAGGDGQTHTLDEIKPIGNIKWVLYDGVLVVANDWTDADVEAQINRDVKESQQNAARTSMTKMNFLNYGQSYLELTPFRNNPYIETIIIGDNIDSLSVEDVVVDCPNIKNIITLDAGFRYLVEGSTPEYTIVDGGERSGKFYGVESMTAENIAHQSTDRRGDHAYNTPGSKGSVTIGFTTTKPNPNKPTAPIVTWPDATTVASQYATAKSYVADMDLPDWALAYLPVEMGGTGTARAIGDVFDFETATLKSDWANGTGSVTETPVTEPENPVTETPAADKVTYSDWAESDIMSAGGKGYLDTVPQGNAPAVTDLLGNDYTRAITRGQFAALAIRFYEQFMENYHPENNSTIAINPGDDVFADSVGNKAMAKAYNLGILGGYNSADSRSGVYVGPNDLITREQAATMLARLMQVIDEKTGRGFYPTTNFDVTLPFTDGISDWALDSVKTMYHWGIMTGTSGTTFSGQSNYTIEQSIVTLMRIDDWGTMGAG